MKVKIFLSLIKKYQLLFIVILLSACSKQDTVTNFSVNNNWFFSSTDDSIWLPASVPGTIHTDLIDNNIIEDPFFRLSEHELQWIDKKDWRYKTNFNVDQETFSSQNIILEFSGLDTYANIIINDSSIYKSDNMFRAFNVDVKNYIKLGNNKIEIVFDSPIKKGLEKKNKLNYNVPISGNDLAEIGQVEGNERVSVFSRKAGYHFGWDWGPRLVTSGIWKPVTLKAWNNFKIDDVYLNQEIKKDKAILKAIVDVDFDNEYVSEELKIEIKLSDNNDYTKRKVISIDQNNLSHKYEVSIEINNPKLWWPNGIGEPNLYNVEISVFDNKIIDSKSLRTGFRTVELIREPDSIGTSFYFKVNGHAVFMKGVNYIPQDVFLNRPSENNYKEILSAAAEANMNMIRVWGGGIYEKDIFYDLCDEKGLLVWQDFMFACAMYPGNDSFLENVKEEAIYNIKRLRNHTSLALWCGNNEVLTAWENWGWKNNEIMNQSQEIADTIFKAYEDIFHKILPDVISKYDSKRSYWPSSPGGGFGKKQKLESGNAHYWWVWWGKKPFSSYNDSIPRFMAEFGFQSFPEFNSVKKYTNESDYNIYSDVMKSHQRSSIGNETIEEYLVRDYNTPKDFENYLYVSQLLQAHGIKIGIEAHRRNMHRCMGSLYWQLNDCWPVASWSGIDYYGKWKALHYQVKKSFSTFLLSHNLHKDTLNIYVISDSLKDVNASLKVKILDFEGNILNQLEEEILVNSNQSRVKMRIPVVNFIDSSILDMSFMSLTLTDGNEKLLADNKIFLKPFKDLKLPNHEINYLILEKTDKFKITLISEKFVKDVFLSINSSNNFSDNYFDLIPNNTKTVFINKEDELSLDILREDLKIFTLDQSYK